jgi:hypothetical protein
MSEFVYLYRGGDRPTSPELMQQQMQKWLSWMKKLGDTGNIKDPGHPLDRSGKSVQGKQRTVTDGPYAEKDVVGGYTLVEARDLAHAVELSSGCPIFDIGGSVEVRPVMKIDR